jgi:uncharacterized membrane protein
MSLRRRRDTDASTASNISNASRGSNASAASAVTTRTSSTVTTVNSQNKVVYRTVSAETLARRQQRAKSFAKGAEGVHAGVRTLTSTVLYPVRWTGRRASKLAFAGSEEEPGANNRGTTKRVILDTIGGIGNAVSSVAKGFTEALSEVGTAIGYSSIHHSNTIYGEEYTQKVTKHYVDAWGEVGLAGYKAINVASLGIYGIVLDAVVEGTALMVCLYDFLVGPVLIQEYINVVTPPFVTPERMYAVLRPWSVAFYRSASNLTGKPAKIIPTSMLDTIPKLRIRADGFEEYTSNSLLTTDYLAMYQGELQRSRDYHVADENQLTDQQLQQQQQEYSDEMDALHAAIEDDDEEWDQRQDSTEGVELGVMSPHLSGAAPAKPPKPASSSSQQPAAKPSNPATKSAAGSGAGVAADKASPKKKKMSMFKTLLGGEKTHIELCTVDCSTYMLYPEHKSMLLWFSELKQACGRVETIKKRKSGAEEIAVHRRLHLLPRNNRIYVKFLKLVIAKDVNVLNDLAGISASTHSSSNSSAASEDSIASTSNHYSLNQDRDEDEDDDTDMLDMESLHMCIDTLVQAEAETVDMSQVVVSPSGGVGTTQSLSRSSNITGDDYEKIDECVDSPVIVNGPASEDEAVVVGADNEEIIITAVPATPQPDDGSANSVNNVYLYCDPENVDSASREDSGGVAVLEGTPLEEDTQASMTSQVRSRGTPPRGVPHAPNANRRVPTATMNSRFHDAIGTVTDPIKNSLLGSVRVTYVPITPAGF